MAHPHNDDLGLDRENGVERLRPEAARKGDAEAPAMHFLDNPAASLRRRN